MWPFKKNNQYIVLESEYKEACDSKAALTTVLLIPLITLCVFFSQFVATHVLWALVPSVMSLLLIVKCTASMNKCNKVISQYRDQLRQEELEKRLKNL